MWHAVYRNTPINNCAQRKAYEHPPRRNNKLVQNVRGITFCSSVHHVPILMSQRRRSLSPLSRNPPGLKKNSVGGIAVDESELKAAFEFFDVSGKGKITLHDLKNRLGTYFLPYIYIYIYFRLPLANQASHTHPRRLLQERSTA